MKPDALKGHSDAQLRAILRQRQPLPQDARPREVAALGDRGAHMAEEQNEMRQLIELASYQPRVIFPQPPDGPRLN